MIDWSMWIVFIMVAFTIFMFIVYLVVNIFGEYQNNIFGNSFSSKARMAE